MIFFFAAAGGGASLVTPITCLVFTFLHFRNRRRRRKETERMAGQRMCVCVGGGSLTHRLFSAFYK